MALEHECRKRRCANAPADQQSVMVTHLPGSERAALPAEALGALSITLAQRLRGERLTGNRLHLGIVLQPKGQRIHCAGVSHFVDGAFERNGTCCLSWCPHEERRSGIDPHSFM